MYFLLTWESSSSRAPTVVQIMIWRELGATAAAGAGALLLLLLPVAFSPRAHAQHEKYATGAAWKRALAQGNTGNSGWFSRW